MTVWRWLSSLSISFLFSNVLTYIAQAYLSLLALECSDWLQMSAQLLEWQNVGPNLKRKHRFGLLTRKLLLCKSTIQHESLHSIAHSWWLVPQKIKTFTALQTFCEYKTEIVLFLTYLFGFHSFPCLENATCSSTSWLWREQWSVLYISYLTKWRICF